MKAVVGIDVGGSTTKIVGFDISDNKRTLLKPVTVKATDPVASVYGAFGKFTSENGVDIKYIKRVMLTGVGSTYIGDNIFGVPTLHVDEFTAVGRGGLYLSKLSEAVIVSMGTGTALVYAKSGTEPEYLGGTGVGGGTLIGLSKKALRMENVRQIEELAADGNLENVDLTISDITKKNIIPTLSSEATAANFGKLSDIATSADIALGIINLILETIGMMGVFTARSKRIKDIVLIGNLSNLNQCKEKFDSMSKMFGVRFMIPEKSQYATVIGTALMHFDKPEETK